MSHAIQILSTVFFFILPVHEELACSTTWRVELVQLLSIWDP